MDRLRGPAARLDRLLPFVLVAARPDTRRNVVIAHLVKYTITSHQNEVVVLVDLKVPDLRVCLDDVRIAAPLEQLRLGVAESARDGEAARQDTYRPDDILWLGPLLVLALRLKCL